MHRKKMKIIFSTIIFSFIAVGSLLFLNFCGGGTTTYTLSNAPTGFKFTNTTGNTISSIGSGSGVQLRDDAGNILFEFTINGDVNFANVVAGRDATKTMVHFPAAGDKAGVSGNLILYMACTGTTDEVHVCPSAATLNEVATGCTDEVTLTTTNPTAGNYTWDNATSRAATEDCQVVTTVDYFNTGAFGQATGGPILTDADFPNVGICSTGTVDVTSDEFKNALAAASAFTFLHKSYSSDADIPFICGKNGTWDPTDAATAFAQTVTINMVDTILDVLNGGFGHVFICNDGFGWGPGATATEGFHAADTYRGEVRFTANATTYRGRVRFSVTGTDANKTLASLGLIPADVTLTDSTGTTLTTVSNVRDLLAANPINITVNAKATGTTRITTTGGFICAGTE